MAGCRRNFPRLRALDLVVGATLNQDSECTSRPVGEIQRRSEVYLESQILNGVVFKRLTVCAI